MKVRVTYVIERGNHIGLVKHAIEGEEVECDRIQFDHGVLILWKRVELLTAEAAAAEGGQMFVEELVKAYGPGTYRTVIPVVGATTQPAQASNEDPRRRQKIRSTQAP